MAKASDNAAYWSISTAMKSDIGAVSAVSDALGLGAAKTDTAYEGLSSTIDILDQFKAKLVTAKEASVDKTKIQAEMDQLKQQLQSVASSSSFNGENWLSTNIPDIENTTQASTTVVSSFIRSESNVKVATTSVDLWGISLFNASGGGSLQADDRSPGTIGGMRNQNYPSNGEGAAVSSYFTTPLVFTDNTTKITFDLTLDADDPSTTTDPQPGTTTSITLDRSLVDSVYPSLHGVISNGLQFAAVVRAATGPYGAMMGTDTIDPNDNLLISNETSGNRGASIQVSNVQSMLADGGTGGLHDTAMDYGARPQTFNFFDQPFHVSETTKLYVPVTVDNLSKVLTIDRSMVDSVLGTATGMVTSNTDLVAIMNEALTENGMGVTATAGNGGAITYTIDEAAHKEAGGKAFISVGPASDNLGVLADFGIMDVDITKSEADVDHYLYGVEGMIKKVTSAASSVGSLQSRIALQSDFTSSLKDSLTTGVGKLVDADMEEDSAKLAATQTQQQLAIQSLSISNTSSQSLLQLFK